MFPIPRLLPHLLSYQRRTICQPEVPPSLSIVSKYVVEVYGRGLPTPYS
jgi:hypothetical protein